MFLYACKFVKGEEMNEIIKKLSSVFTEKEILYLI